MGHEDRKECCGQNMEDLCARLKYVDLETYGYGILRNDLRES